MPNSYKRLPVRRESFKNVEVGDYLRLNHWRKGMKVANRSKNFILLIDRMFDKTVYSVIDICKGKRITAGPDNFVFSLYNYGDEENQKEALEGFEKGELKVSKRHGMIVEDIFHKKKTKKENV